ncbi:response regulator [Candidatus Saccharibacteria bacterium]|nr:response regulator [Candidatus Saccharibacteria bacterium]
MKKILIIEDDRRWADLLGRYAEEVGANYRLVSSAEQAIETIDEWYPDVIVLDILLAGATGVALLNELRTHSDLINIPIVICSSLELSTDEMRGFGVQSVLDKQTATPEQFREAIGRLIYEPR